jgi:hypothetical protein
VKVESAVRTYNRQFRSRRTQSPGSARNSRNADAGSQSDNQFFRDYAVTRADWDFSPPIQRPGQQTEAPYYGKTRPPMNMFVEHRRLSIQAIPYLQKSPFVCIRRGEYLLKLRLI